MDKLHALTEDRVWNEGASEGPLAGLTFAVKDLIDVEGAVTGLGNPMWKATHAPAKRTAPIVQMLLDAGATLVGKAFTDEFAYSLIGINEHYGMPLNPKAPGHIPGGSSSGSASAVAGGLVDFAIGTDTGGSVRVPASHCGIYGIRTTHGSLPMDGVYPLSPTFDSLGWFAEELNVMQRIAEGLGLPQARVLTDCLVVDEVWRGDLAALRPRGFESIRLCLEGFEEWARIFTVIEGYEMWAEYGEWIETHQASLGAFTANNVACARAVTREQYRLAQQKKEEIGKRIRGVVGEGVCLVVPSAVGPAPLQETPLSALADFCMAGIALGCFAGFASLPQVSLPLASVKGLPMGLSLIGPSGSDRELLTAWKRFFQR